jgi:hypothetical protein
VLEYTINLEFTNSFFINEILLQIIVLKYYLKKIQDMILSIDNNCNNKYPCPIKLLQYPCLGFVYLKTNIVSNMPLAYWSIATSFSYWNLYFISNPKYMIFIYFCVFHSNLNCFTMRPWMKKKNINMYLSIVEPLYESLNYNPNLDPNIWFQTLCIQVDKKELYKSFFVTITYILQSLRKHQMWLCSGIISKWVHKQHHALESLK